MIYFLPMHRMYMSQVKIKFSLKLFNLGWLSTSFVS